MSEELRIARIRRWRADGYRVTLMFLAIPTLEEAIERVRLRMSQGGHNVPEDEVARAHGTKVVVHIDGKTVKMEPDPEMFDALDPP